MKVRNNLPCANGPEHICMHACIYIRVPMLICTCIHIHGIFLFFMSALVFTCAHAGTRVCTFKCKCTQSSFSNSKPSTPRITKLLTT